MALSGMAHMDATRRKEALNDYKWSGYESDFVPEVVLYFSFGFL